MSVTPHLFLQVLLFVLLSFVCANDDNVFINQRSRKEREVQQSNQFSNLQFNIYDELHGKEMSRKRQNSFWGRLYIDGIPGQNGMQYFRAHFGQLPQSSHRVKFVLGQHLDECSGDYKQSSNEMEVIDGDTILVVKRGNCTFGEKAEGALAAGAGGILFVNNEEGIIHPTAQGKLDLDVSVTMISMYNGERLINALNKSPFNYLSGKYIPMTCIMDNSDNKSYCHPIDDKDETYVNDFFNFLNGTLMVDDANDLKYEQGQFGSRIENEDSYPIVTQSFHNLHTFCDDSYQGNDLIGKAVMVDRGGCNFSEKASNLDLVGAKMMILVNHDETAFVMNAESDYIASKISLVAVMVSNETGKIMNEKLKSGKHGQQVRMWSSELSDS